MSNLVQIYTSVSGNIQQDIKIIVDDVSPESLVKGLKSGEYATTISHSAEGSDCGCVIQINPFRIIGKVVYQEALDDLELSDYRLVE